MALIKLPKDEKLTPEKIQSKLFWFHDVAHKFHLDTKSFAIHKATNFLYKELVEFKDDICELLQGYTGETIGEIEIDKIPKYSDAATVKLAKDLMDFAYQVYEYGEENKYCDIENTAQSLSGIAAKFNFLLTLK